MKYVNQVVKASMLVFQASLAEAAARGTAVNHGGVAVGAGGEGVPCWAVDDFGLANVSLLKIDAVRPGLRLMQDSHCS